MKKTLLVIGAAMGLSFASQAQQWQEQDLNYAYPLRETTDISIPDSNTVWTIGVNRYQFIPNTAEFSRTTNGGTTWVSDSIPGLSNFILTSISALNADTAWITASGAAQFGARIYRTNDGGANWIRQNNTGFTVTGFANAIHFFNATDGVALGDVSGGYTEVYTTIDGGTTWTRVPQANLPAGIPGEYSYYDAIATLGNTIWYGTSEGRILKSVNKGVTWTTATLPAPASEVENIAFSDANNGLVLAYINSNEKGMFKTTDGGATWTALASPSPFFNYDLTNVPGAANTFVTVGTVTSGTNTTVGLNFTTNNGTTWTPIPAPTGTNDLFSVNFLNQNHGWAGSITIPDTTGGPSIIGGIYKLNNMLAPCAGTPTAGSIPSSIQVCPGLPPTITAIGASAGTGITYQWQESDDNGVSDPWAAAVGGSGANTNAYTLPANFSTSKWYRLVVTCTASSQTDTTITLQATFSSGAVSAYPYVEDFNNVNAPNVPCGIIVDDANTDGFTWQTRDISATDNVMVYGYNSNDVTVGANDWFFTPALTMQVGYDYMLTFDYRSALASFPEGLEVRWGTSPSAASMPAANTIFSNNNITNNTFASGVAAPVRPTANGTYYIGFKAISAPDMFNLYVDNLRITEQVTSGMKENILTNKVLVFPNPSAGLVNVTIKEIKAGSISAEIVNSLGQKVYSAALVNNQTNELNLSELASGIYILKVQADGHVATKRITIQK